MRHQNRDDDSPGEDTDDSLVLDGERAEGPGAWGLDRFDVAIVVLSLVGLAILVIVAW